MSASSTAPLSCSVFLSLCFASGSVNSDAVPLASEKLHDSLLCCFSAILAHPEELVARSRQKHFADPERTLPHRESARRQSHFSVVDSPLSGRSAPGIGAPGGGEQLFLARRIFLDRHAHSELLRDFHSCSAGRRRPGGHLERVGDVEAKRRTRPWPRRPNKNAPERYFSECFLSLDPASHGGPGFNLHRHHAGCQPTAPSGS